MEVIRLSGYDTQEKIAIATRYLVPKALKECGLVEEKENKKEDTFTEKEKEGLKEEETITTAATTKVDNIGKEEEVTAETAVVKEHSSYDSEIHEKTSKSSIIPKENIPIYEIDKDGLEFLIKKYCRESGVRSLEKTIEKIARKLAYEHVGHVEEDKNNEKVTESTSTSSSVTEEIRDGKRVVQVSKEQIEKFIGKPIFHDDTMYDDAATHGLPVGVVLGLAWNPYGGSPIFIETVAVPCSFSERDSGVHMVTGQLGAVMKESVNIAYTFARRFIREKETDNKFFHSNQIHLHVPEGAISKDGPSAGISMTTSFLSVAMNKKVKPNVAMTGELSLTGKVSYPLIEITILV
jgi:Lon-like ATP-dependent protease